MNNDKSNISIYIGAIIVIVLQVFLGSIISINSIVPNFLLAYVIVCIVLRPDKLHLTFAFIIGLIYDLIFSGPVGSMAFVLVVFSFIVSKVLLKTKVSSLGISLLIIFISVFFVELFYGIFQISIFIDASFADVMTYRVLPCTIFDVILAFIMFIIMARVLAPPITANTDSSITHVNDNRW